MSVSSSPLYTPKDFHLPYSSYREGQIEALLFVSTSVKRVKLINAPTGSGKTLINHSIPRLIGGTYSSLRTLYLVHTKALQDQSYHDLSCTGLTDIRGHGNYPCAIRSNPSSPSASDSSWECSAEKSGRSCQYRSKVQEAIKSNNVQTNYSHWLSIARSGDPDRLGEFDLIICDEGHLVHDLVVDHMTVSIRRGQIRRLLELDIPDPSDNRHQWIQWSSLALETCQLVKKPVSKDERAELVKLENDLAHLEWGLRNQEIEWVFKPADSGSSSGVDVIPVWGRKFVERYLFRNISNVVITSGTINLFDAYELGLADSDIDFLELESNFPASNRPFIYSPCTPDVYVDFRMENSPSKVKTWAAKMDRLISDRLDRKGIIQAWAYKYAKLFYSNSRHRDSGILITHDSRGAKEAISRFNSSNPPTVLVSPSVKEGYDFPFDKCRYQIFPKVPTIDKRDLVIAARIKSDPTYLDRKTCRTIEQMAGRGMRDAKDWCECVMIDAYWTKLREKKQYFSRWFRASWKYASVVKPMEMGREVD